MITVGGQCEGYGGLFLALQRLLPVEHAWYAEVDPAASKILAAHYPGVPNHGDITAPGGPFGTPRRHLSAPRRERRAARVFARRVRGWRQLAAVVDIFTAGFPCQGFSLAGKRQGSSDERHLWPTGVLPAITALRPRLVVLENVPGLLTIENGQAFGKILADLDRLGYRVSWTTVGACKVGACHHRHRVFIAATLVDVRAPFSDPIAHRDDDAWLPAQNPLFGDHEALKWPQAGYTAGGAAWEMPSDVCGANAVMLPTPTATPYGNNQSPSEGAAVRPSLEGIFQMLPTPRVSDTNGAGQHGDGGPDLRTAVTMLPTPRVSAARTGRSAILNSASSPSLEQAFELARGEMPRELESWGEAPASWLPTPVASDADRQSATYARGNPTLLGSLAEVASEARGVGSSAATPRASDATKGGPNQRGSSGDLALPAAVQGGRFGSYAAAVARQESAFGLPAPAPTEPGRNGKPRLSPAFTEWMVGLPAGWLTEHIGRPQAIARAGNGVVPQQAAYALGLLPTFRAAAAELTARQAVAA